MKIEIKDTIVGTKPSRKVSEIITQLSSIDDASRFCQQLSTSNLDEIGEEVPKRNVLVHMLGYILID